MKILNNIVRLLKSALVLPKRVFGVQRDFLLSYSIGTAFKTTYKEIILLTSLIMFGTISSFGVVQEIKTNGSYTLFAGNMASLAVGTVCC